MIRVVTGDGVHAGIDRLVLLDEPYVSQQLQDGIVTHGWRAFATGPVDLRHDTRKRLITEPEAVSMIRRTGSLVYTNSENALGFYLSALRDARRRRAIATLKDKHRFRELLASIYPELAFREVPLEALDRVDPAGLRFPLVLKPSIGFFSAGVQIVRTRDAWRGAVQALLREMETDRLNYPATVLDRRKILIEDYLDGPEIAVDAYYDAQGKPVVLNAMLHVFPCEQDTRDILYLTNRSIVESVRRDVDALLRQLGALLELRSFPLHLEVRRPETGAGRVVPIEVNPNRFAGWCTTDLASFAYGIDVYECFLHGQAPDPAVFAGDDATYGFVILHPPAGTRFPQGWTVDPHALTEMLGDVLELRLVDHQRWGILGIAFVRYATQEEAQRAVHIDLGALV